MPRLGDAPPRVQAVGRAVLRLCCAGLVLGPVACKGSAQPPEPDPAPAATVSSPHVRVSAAAPAGGVGPIVREALARAVAQRRRVLVYVGASWCEPCQRVHQAADRGDLDGVLGDVDLLEFDWDRDGDRLREAGYTSRYVPLFALPRADGMASGKQVEGAVKGEGAIAFIVPRLKKLLTE